MYYSSYSSNIPRFPLPKSSTSPKLALAANFCSSVIGFYEVDPKPETFHAKLVKAGLIGGRVSRYLLCLYVRRLDFIGARKLFDEIPDKDVRTWTALLSGVSRGGGDVAALGLGVFRDMLEGGVRPNAFTLSSVLKCCAGLGDVRSGKCVHGWALRNGGWVGMDVVFWNAVLDLYVKCGELGFGGRLFETMVEKDTVSWNVMIGGLVANGDVGKSVELFWRMPVKDSASWNTVIDGLMRNGMGIHALEMLYEMERAGALLGCVSFSIALVLVASMSLLSLGREIHGRIMRLGMDNNGFVRNSLIDMYSKCGDMRNSMTVFEHMPRMLTSTKDGVMVCADPIAENMAYSSLVSGYVKNGEYGAAFEVFRRKFAVEPFKVDKYSITSIISACGNAGVLELGQQIHALVEKIGHKQDAHLCSSLIDMYAKCGSLDDAQLVFERSEDSNSVVWTSMISGLAFHGQGRNSVALFRQMLDEGFLPNEITFLGVLTACCHAGLLEVGREYFRIMKEVYRIKPSVEHLTCMVDLFGRSGHFDEIWGFIDENGISDVAAVWRSVLSSCRLHKENDLGNWVSQKLLHLSPSDPEPYILMANMRAGDKKWLEAAQIRNQMQKRGLRKHPGQSWMYLNNHIQTFSVGDNSHPQADEIYSYLGNLVGRLREIGYSPDAKLVMHDVEDEEGEMIISFHSEKLALAYGIINLSPGSRIRVMKNLRICTDCHNFMKFASKLLRREIVVRDIHRFHHFGGGNCSCDDFW
ncbi:hypothetical protein MLD38_019377 [Melastoma candidum]|uniref:Uncharacterized protein n=1 Tax=Melastoma candidum TaxID=119954 RepID=A0ACB9QXX1_9MYRT|nr:hypothetical protein MLD38_019377 [Melastoma candidum]